MPSETTASTKTRALVAAGLTATLVVVAYLPSMAGPFVFDAHSEIVRNPAIRVLWPPSTPMWAGGRLAHRPIPYYTFALNHAACGLEPFGWHLVNVAIHLVNGLLAWFVLRNILRVLDARSTPACSASRDLVAWVSVTAWLVHPLCTQAVSYVYQRIEALAATSMLGAAACLLAAQASSHRFAWRATSVACAATGMLCKESAVAIPLVLFLMAWLVLPPRAEPGKDVPPAGWARLGPTLRADGAYWATLAATWVVAGWVVWMQRDRFGELTRPAWTPWEYALQQPRSILRYLQLAVWPAGQCIDYGWRPVGLIRLVPGWTAVATLGAAAAWSVGRVPGLALAIGSFFVMLGPTSSILPVVDLCVEHRMYLPLLPISATLVAGSAALLQRVNGCLAWRLTMAVVVIALTATTSFRNGVFASAEALWSDALVKAPDNPRTAIELAAVHLGGQRYTDAAVVAAAALERRPASIFRAVLLTWLARARIGMGERSPEVLAILDDAVAADPTFTEAHFERGDLLTSSDPAEAARSYALALETDPRHANACNNLAGLLVGTDPDAAVGLMRRAVAADPDRILFRLHLAKVLVAVGRMAEAAETSRAVLAMPCTTAERAAAENLLRHSMPQPPQQGPVP